MCVGICDGNHMKICDGNQNSACLVVDVRNKLTAKKNKDAFKSEDVIHLD